MVSGGTIIERLAYVTVTLSEMVKFIVNTLLRKWVLTNFHYIDSHKL